MEEETSTATPTPPKFSRYRSVRIAAAPESVAPALPQPTAQDAVKKSMSRYRQARPVKPPASIPAIPSASSAPEPRSREEGQASHGAASPIAATNVAAHRQRHLGESDKPFSQSQTPTAPQEPRSGQTSSERARQEAYEILTGERVSDSSTKPEPARRDVHPGPGPRVAVRRAEPTKATPPAPHGVHGDDAAAAKPEPVASTAGPGFDAPVSAVNFGERRVLVKCNQSSILLPVNLSTTTIDILRSAANVLSENIDIGASVLVEYFKLLGLERPLRRYECVRDVMNSWDDGNALRIVPSSTGGNDEDLDITKVPKEHPGDTTVNMHYSNKPGSWDKRWITLRADGQMLISKHKGVDLKNICHMSDFDIYLPTPRQFKKLKCSKQSCCAVKSQQKSSMFLSTANFVHFFASNDEEVASLWYKSVQGWRSWYLVNVMGKGGHATKQVGIQRHATKGTTNQHVRNSSVPYQIGSFMPLLPEQELIKLTDPNEAAEAQDSLRQIHKAVDASLPQTALASRGGPPAPVRKSSANEGRSLAPTVAISRKGGLPYGASEEGPFLEKGLLGRAYTQRRTAMREDTDERNTTYKGPPKDSNTLARGKSQYKTPVPLIDLTPTQQEPLPHIPKGHGVVPNTIPAGGLVEIATGPEIAVPVPSSKAWRRPIGAAEDTSLHRPDARHGGGHQKSHAKAAAGPDADPIFAGGLLSQAGHGQGGRSHGRGIVSQDRHAKEPMLELDHPSRFAPGSLLAGVEKHAGGSGPIMDREKRKEMSVSVGEGA